MRGGMWLGAGLVGAVLALVAAAWLLLRHPVLFGVTLGLIGVVAAAVKLALFLMVLWERLRNEEDDHYAKNVER